MWAPPLRWVRTWGVDICAHVAWGVDIRAHVAWGVYICAYVPPGAGTHTWIAGGVTPPPPLCPCLPLPIAPDMRLVPVSTSLSFPQCPAGKPKARLPTSG
eukprot:356105-Chlamydomonas_euryale.AAC.4